VGCRAGRAASPSDNPPNMGLVAGAGSDTLRRRPGTDPGQTQGTNPAMARHKESAAAETLHEIEGAADRLGDWVQSNLALVVSAIVGLLVVVGLASYISRSGKSAEQEASRALAETQNAYLVAMGAGPGVLDVPELASPAAAARIRAEYTERFTAVADAHPGTVSGALARLEVAQLALAGEDATAGVALYEQILADGTPNSRLRGIVLQQLAQGLESAERWGEAGARHEEAANLSEYPLRHWALADAARCFHAAGETDKARALFDRLDVDAPDLRLPDHQRALKREVQAATTP